MSTTLYRHFGHDGKLLYVGIANEPPARLRQHRKDKEWWIDVRNTTHQVFDTRPEAKAAEREAIKAENPTWNIQHNNSGTKKPRPRLNLSTTSIKPANRVGLPPFYTFDAQGRRQCGARLVLYWEVLCDPYPSDDYDYPEISAPEMFRMWAKYYRDNYWEKHGDEVPIHWFVESVGKEVGTAGMCESSPFEEGSQNFLTYFSHPYDLQGNRLNWYDLPVVDKLWQPPSPDGWPVKASKGGHIQSATGWKPSAFQSSVSWHLLCNRYIASL